MSHSHPEGNMRLTKAMLVVFAIFAATTFAATGSVHAKGMESRLGIGFRNSFPFNLPAIAAQYYPNSNLGLIGALGIDTEEDNSKFALQFGLRKRIFEEDNLNFFMGGNFALLTQEIAKNKTSGYELSALVATEFFLAGLENLGFNMEAGVAVSNMEKVRFRTVGESFLTGGVIFYF